MKLDDDENFADFSMSFLAPNSVQKKDAQKGRYSWCAHGDSPYVQKNVNTRNAHSDYYSYSSSSSVFDSDTEKKASPKSCGQSVCQSSCKCACGMSLSERGVPEGQEDPGTGLETEDGDRAGGERGRERRTWWRKPAGTSSRTHRRNFRCLARLAPRSTTAPATGPTWTAPCRTRTSAGTADTWPHRRRSAT